MDYRLAVQNAVVELKSKTIEHIHFDTSMQWLARAAAAYVLFKETKNSRWLLDAQDYTHEALEHAALSESAGATIDYIQVMILQFKRDAGI